LSPHPSAI